jgi:hypothetical protein
MTTATTPTELVTPLSILEADMPATHKISFQFLLHLCRTEQRNQISGSKRALAKRLYAAKTTFDRMIPQWVQAGWVTFVETGKQITLILARQLCPVPQRDTVECAPAFDGPERDKNGPVSSQIGPLASAQAVITITDITLEKESNVIIYHDQAEKLVPELTPELFLELAARSGLTVPKRPTNAAELERWHQHWRTPAQDIIEKRLRPIAGAGPMAWELADEVIRFMLSPASGWYQHTQGFSPWMCHVRDKWQIQVDQIGRFRWTPEERTPYPGCDVPNRDTEELAPVSDVRQAAPLSWDDLEQFAKAVMTANPSIQLAVEDLPDGEAGILLAQYGPDAFVEIDSRIWNDPTPQEEALILQAIAYGRSLVTKQQSSRELALV